MDSEDSKLLADCPGVQSGRLLPELLMASDADVGGSRLWFLSWMLVI
jgi:hypothetical protein